MTQALLNAIEGKEDSRQAVWFLRQAGRYLPEYRKLRENYSFLDMCSNPKLAAEVTLQPLERFDLDAAIIFADILLLLMPLGQDLSFKKDHGPVLRPAIRTKNDFKNFLNLSPSLESLNYVGEAVSMVRNTIPKDKSVIGFAGAPFTVASYMIEGSGSKNFHHTKKILFSDPSLFKEIMLLLTENTAKYLKKQIDGGADVIMLFDSWAGALAPRDYQEHILPHVQTLKSFVSFHGKKLIYYSGSNPQNASLVDESHCDVLHLDWRIDLDMFFKERNSSLCYQGNLDPQALFLEEAPLRRKVRNLLNFFKEKAPNKHIFNVGHGLIPQTPIRSLEIVLDEIRSQ